jgi:hypothetical protein
MAFAKLTRDDGKTPLYVNPTQVVYVSLSRGKTVIGLTGALGEGLGRVFSVLETPEEVMQRIDTHPRP